ncbi:MOS1T transposase, partial [Pseudoatta argentina]
MSIFVPNKVYLRGILLHYFIQKKSAAEAHRILVQTYGDKILQVDESTVSKRLKGLGMIQKQGHWVPYELKPRTTASTAEKKRFFASHRIVTGDEKWIHYDNLSFLRRSSKMDRFLDSLKRHVVFPTRDSCTARKMGESGL